MKRKPSKKPPRVRVVVLVIGDEPLYFDFNLARKPTDRRVRSAMEAFNGSISRTRTTSQPPKTSTK
jgi:hypothetical protein